MKQYFKIVLWFSIPDGKKAVCAFFAFPSPSVFHPWLSLLLFMHLSLIVCGPGSRLFFWARYRKAVHWGWGGGGMDHIRPTVLLFPASLAPCGCLAQEELPTMAQKAVSRKQKGPAGSGAGVLSRVCSFSGITHCTKGKDYPQWRDPSGSVLPEELGSQAAEWKPLLLGVMWLRSTTSGSSEGERISP